MQNATLQRVDIGQWMRCLMDWNKDTDFEAIFIEVLGTVK